MAREDLTQLYEFNKAISKVIQETYNRGYDQGINDGKDKFDEHSYCEGVIKGRNEAWECARKLIEPASMGGISSAELESIFGNCSGMQILKGCTAYEVITKIKVYEEKKTEAENQGIISLAKEKAKLMADKLDNDQTAKEFLKWYRSNIGR